MTSRASYTVAHDGIRTLLGTFVYVIRNILKSC